MYSNQAQFTFSFTGWSGTYTIDASTVSDMSTDVYLNFASGSKSPIIETNPQKWDKYTCGRTLYWRITSQTGNTSPIQATQIACAPAPTATIKPSPTATQATPSVRPATPTPSGTTKLSLQLLLHGIGKGGDNVNPVSTGNMNPLRKQRQVSVELFDATNHLTGNKTGTIIFNETTGTFIGSVDINTLPSGSYTARVKVAQYLQKTIPGIISITSGQTMTMQPFTLIAGDSNNDNRLSILDYNLILDCFSDLSPAKNCPDTAKKQTADLTDDGNVNQFDYNLFLRELSVQTGQ